MAETLQERMARLKAEEAKKNAASKPQPRPKPQPDYSLGISGMPKKDAKPAAQDVSISGESALDAVLQSPSVIYAGLRKNAAGVLANAGLNTLMQNAYTAAKEGRNPLPGLGLDAAMFLASPLRGLRLAAKMGPVKKISNSPLVKPITKTTSIKTNALRNAGTEAAIGAGDNAIYGIASDKLNGRDFNPYSLGISAGLGAATGAGAGVLLAREQAMKANNYKKWLTPLSYKNKTKENIRNAQNETGSNLETFSKMVNEESPFTTTAALSKKNEAKKKEIGAEMDRHRSSPEANAPAENAAMSDFQKILQEKLDNDFSGNLSQSEKDLVIKNFYDDATDMLIGNSPSLQKYMREKSMHDYGRADAYKANDIVRDEIMSGYSLTPNDMDLLRRNFSNKTTLTIPSKAGYVRAGEDNRGNNEYARMFKREIETRPETKETDRLNKEFSKAANQEELVKEVLSKQGVGGITDSHFPFFDLNPEINPTVFGSGALKARNAANTLLSGGRNLSEIPQENKEDYYKILAAMSEDARKLGIKTEEGVQKYIMSRLEGGNIPEHEIVLRSSQKRGEK